MKFSCTLLIAMFFGFIAGYGQAYKCGTDQSDAFMHDLLRNKKDWERTIQKGQVERFVPVQFHLVADNDGSGRASEREVLKALCLLNERYDSIELRFYMAEAPRLINNTTVNNNPGAFSSTQTMRNLKNNAAMNIYVLEAPGDGIAGYYTREPNDFIVMGKRFLANEAYTLEHEVGHFFTLSHTHRGWEDMPYDPDVHGDTVTITSISSSQSNSVGVELVDGSNCGNLGWSDPLAGDGICDTPPDYGFGQACNCCFMQWTVYDRNGDLIEPMLNNVMSYSQGCGDWNFSQQQVFAMKTSYDSGRRSYLRTGTVNDYAPITEPAALLLPANTAVVENYDGVLLTWEPVENAEEYLISVDGTISNSYRTSETELYLTDLKPNGNYLWSVQATNKFGSGCVANDARIFFTGSGTTSVNELEELSDIKVYPNPVPANERIKVQMVSTGHHRISMRLLSLDGKVISANDRIEIQAGPNIMTIPTLNTASGLYLLELRKGDKIMIEKIIIE